MTIGNELMHECFPQHLRMGTARNKTEKEKKIIILLKQDYNIQLANNKIQMAWLTSWLVVG